MHRVHHAIAAQSTSAAESLVHASAEQLQRSIKDLEKRISDLSSVRRHHRYPSAVALEGQAPQVLWQLSKGATEAYLVKLLSNTESQAERFKAELASSRRKPGESIQTVCSYIRHLLALSFHGESGSILEVIGCDAFLTALNDSALRISVLDQKATTLDEATGECQ